MALVQKQDDDFAIKPQAVTPALDTSNWPLLLKNYDKRTMRSSDYYSMIRKGGRR
jgi:H/ACA ribonucleoprotein complex subunit 4